MCSGQTASYRRLSGLLCVSGRHTKCPARTRAGDANGTAGAAAPRRLRQLADGSGRQPPRPPLKPSKFSTTPASAPPRSCPQLPAARPPPRPHKATLDGPAAGSDRRERSGDGSDRKGRRLNRQLKEKTTTLPPVHRRLPTTSHSGTGSSC